MAVGASPLEDAAGGRAGVVLAEFETIHYPLFTIRCYNSLMPQTLQSLAEFTATHLIGDGGIEIARVASIRRAQPGDLVFVQEEKHLEQALASAASAVIA